MNIFSQIQKDISIYDFYKVYIIELLDLIIKYRFTPSIYLTFILEKLSQSNIPFELIKNKIEKILYIPSNQEDIEEIKINNLHDLQKLLNLFKLYFRRYFCKNFLEAIF